MDHVLMLASVALSIVALISQGANGQFFSCPQASPTGSVPNFQDAWCDFPGNDFSYFTYPNPVAMNASICTAYCLSLPNCVSTSYVDWNNNNQFTCYQKSQALASDICCQGQVRSIYLRAACNVSQPANGVATYNGWQYADNNPCFVGICNITYSCNVPYVMNGSAQSSCVANGSSVGYISPPEPTCSTAYLCPPLTLANGTVTGASPAGSTLGTTATFACDACFTMHGSSTTTCVQPAQNQPYVWNVTTPTCVPSPYYFNTNYTFTCNASYALLPTGPTSMVYMCGCTSTWSSPFEACTLTCPVISSIANGTITIAGNTSSGLGGAPFVGSVATFTCAAGQNLVGPTTSTCQASGSWAPAVTTNCQPIPCSSTFFDASGTTGYTSYFAGSTYTFTCDQNYIIAATDTSSASYTCTSTGTWSPATFVSCVPTCPAVPTYPNGQFAVAGVVSQSLGGRPVATATATLSCAVGSNLTGMATVTCQASGQWSGAFGTCVYENCPPIFDNTGVPSSAGPYHSNTLYTFTCNQNMAVPATDAVVTTYNCTSSATWAQNFASCVATCPNEWPMMNGYITLSQNVSVLLSGRAFAGTTAMVACNRNYVINGVNSIFCMTNGQWSTEFPTCQPVSTTPAPTVATPPPSCGSWISCWWWLWLLITIATISTALLIGIYLLKKFANVRVRPTTCDKSF